MNPDEVTILYYTSNIINEVFASKIIEELKSLSDGIAIISISQKPIGFGENVCVGDIGASTYNVYRQVLVGAKLAKTKYVMCCEDDSIYNKEHLAFDIDEDGFWYNVNQWQLLLDKFRKRVNFHPNMSSCIARTDLMVDTLEERFKKYPENKGFSKFGEPGIYEKYLGLPEVKWTKFETKAPILTIKHRKGLSRMGGPLKSDIFVDDLDPFGNAIELRQRLGA